MLGLNTALHATRQGLHHWSSSPWDVTDFWASYLVALVCASVFSHYYPVFITIAFHIFSSQKLWCLQICSSCSKILKLVMLIGGSALVKTDFYFCKKCQRDLKESHQVCHSCRWCGQFVFLFPVFMHVHTLLDVWVYMYAQSCEGPRVLDSSFLALLLYWSRQNLWIKPRAHWCVFPASLPWKCHFHLLRLELQDGHHTHPVFIWISGDLNSSPHTSEGQALEPLSHLPSQCEYLKTY